MSNKNSKKLPSVRRTRKLESDRRWIYIGVGIVLLLFVLSLIAGIFIWKKVKTSDSSRKTENISEVSDTQKANSDPTASKAPDSDITISPTMTPAVSPVVTALPENTEDSSEIEKLISEMSLEQKIDQMFLITPLSLARTQDSDLESATVVGEATQTAYDTYHIGAFLVSSDNKNDDGDITELCSGLQKESAGKAQIPALIFVDETDLKELGYVSDGSTSIDDSTLSEDGIQVILTHSAQNTSLSLQDRDGSITAFLAPDDFLKGYEDSTAGNYETKASTYLSQISKDTALVVLTDGIYSIDDDLTLETIRQQVRNSSEEETKGAGYEGLLISSPLTSAEDTTIDVGEAGVRLLLAGCDILYCPEDFLTVRSAILDAVESNRIPEERIDESIIRILNFKQNLFD
jgi:sulfur transfer complex TusBCD TusB component (DsrH family)